LTGQRAGNSVAADLVQQAAIADLELRGSSFSVPSGVFQRSQNYLQFGLTKDPAESRAFAAWNVSEADRFRTKRLGMLIASDIRIIDAVYRQKVRHIQPREEKDQF
jgi:hypothetical protein